MLIALVGTPSAGKEAVLDYLLQRAFVRLDLDRGTMQGVRENGEVVEEQSVFPTADALLEHATRNWRTNYVTRALDRMKDVEPFLKRPFFLLVAVDGPMGVRYARERFRRGETTLESFVAQHDALLHSDNSELARLFALAPVRVDNRFPSIPELHAHLDALDLLDEQRLRPGWDRYFMTLASLAAHRSNCMKRRVGAVLVRSKRIISTGYNGTPRGTVNCNQGGCGRCNGPAKGGEGLNTCLCLHAEENALLEAGRDRIGPDAVIYCNTCPCLLCSVKIVQCGVREVVYNQSYSMDTASAAVLKEGGVILRQLNMPLD